jgi:hypothetical protein
VELSKKRFNTESPYWQDYLSYLQQLKGRDFPGCDQINALLPVEIVSGGGHPIRFVHSGQLEDEPYERRIYSSGRVSTRPDNWHDLFNALVWMRYPRIKAAMNKLHYDAWSEQKSGSRGPLRDALTLFDECGVIVFSRQMPELSAFAKRRWLDAFKADNFNTKVQLSLCGHAMLEKYLSPYKAMTAKALLIHIEPGFSELNRTETLNFLDGEIAKRMLTGELLTKPADLTPLPLAGVPGWWPETGQDDEAFYDDPQVFRPAPINFTPANVPSIQQN